MNDSSKISFGDNVKVLESEVTIQNKLAGLQGVIYGETVPSNSGVEVIGELKSDFALNVHFEDLNTTFWMSPHLLEFIDHNEGLKMGVGNKEWVRDSRGEWIESKKPGGWRNFLRLFNRKR
jgi:hypothetical protein